MSVQRKKIIIAEVNYWKQNKLLPEHYCDFLIALYSEGEHRQEVDATVESVLSKKRKKFNLRYLIPILLTVGAGAGMFMFTDLKGFTVLVALMTIIGLLLTAFFGKKKETDFVSLLYILSAILVLGMSLKVWLLLFEGQALVLVGLLLFNCLIWLVAGKLLKLLYFTISGVGGLALIIFFIANATI